MTVPLKWKRKILFIMFDGFPYDTKNNKSKKIFYFCLGLTSCLDNGIHVTKFSLLYTLQAEAHCLYMFALPISITYVLSLVHHQVCSFLYFIVEIKSNNLYHRNVLK